MTGELVRTRLTLAWAALLAITIVSLVTGHAMGNPGLSGGLVLALAFAKAWIVIREFMEVRHAPPWLRLVTNTWVVGACALLLTLHAM